MLFGINTFWTVSKSPKNKEEVKVFEEKLQVQTKFQEIIKNFFAIQTTRQNCLPLFLKILSVLTAQTTNITSSNEVKVKSRDYTSSSCDHEEADK